MGLGIDDLLKDKRDEILRIAAEHGASNVRVFGSVARGEAGPDSDVDLLVEFKLGRGPWYGGDLIIDLEDLLDRRVDVATVEELHWYIRDRVLQEAVPL
jgi:predicted nucleotidyltransferase